MPSDSIICALDIGTTKIVAVVAEMDENGGVYVIGHGVSKAEGLRRGIVVDMDKTVKSIRRAIDDAQLVSGTEVDRITVGIAGEHVRSINSHGVIAVSRSDNEITASDVKRAVEAARTVAIPVDREIIHVIPQTFSVDDQAGIKDPVGMSGTRLEVEAHIVTASITSARNIYRALERCNLDVDHMVLESLATSETLLSENELDAGVIVVDIGDVETGIIVDKVSEVMNILAEDIEDAPSFGANANTDYILGIGKAEERVTILLDISKLLSQSDVFVATVPPVESKPSVEATTEVEAESHQDEQEEHQEESEHEAQEAQTEQEA